MLAAGDHTACELRALLPGSLSLSYPPAAGHVL